MADTDKTDKMTAHGLHDWWFDNWQSPDIIDRLASRDRYRERVALEAAADRAEKSGWCDDRVRAAILDPPMFVRGQLAEWDDGHIDLVEYPERAAQCKPVLTPDGRRIVVRSGVAYVEDIT